MKNQPKDKIEKQQQSRVDHLKKEIQTFKDNIKKILDKNKASTSNDGSPPSGEGG